MKKYLDLICLAFFIAGFIVGALKYILDFPSWLLVVIGAIVSILGEVIKKKLQ